MEATSPADFLPLNRWFEQYGTTVFKSPKLLHYHTRPIQKDLIEAGAMARVGVHLFMHKNRFWPEYQRIMANLSRGEK